ncbi:MAG: LacI family transcriptional regulator [Ruminococcaceae bacterium]|nr:LacI family transcriptional regulator [Oscillospiraceae bacterium]
MSKLTIKDIAKMAGVSTTVVSFVINGKEGVSPKTRKKVEDIIASTNFVPNLSSRRLILNKSFNICIVVKSTSNPFNNFFYFEIAQGLLEKSSEYGYNIVFSEISDDFSKHSFIDILERGDADGVVFFQNVDNHMLDYVNSKNIPAVLIDSTIQNSFNYINADYSVSAYTATKHLIDMGHKEIGFISSNFSSTFFSEVFSGFSKALNENGILISLDWLCIDANSEKEAYDAMDKILSSSKRPSAVFCAADMLAINAMKCAKDHGLKIPEDISFIGIDDIIISKYIEPSLTTIKIDKKEMGRFAIELLVNKLDGKPTENIIVPSDCLIARDSVKKI